MIFPNKSRKRKEIEYAGSSGSGTDAGNRVRRSYGSRCLNTSTDVASTVVAGRRFKVGIDRGKNEYLYGVELLPML